MVLKNLYKIRSINLTVYIIIFGGYIFYSNQNMRIYLKKIIYRNVSNNFTPFNLLLLSSVSFLLYNIITTLAIYPALHHLKRVDRLAYARTCTITSANRGTGPSVERTFVALNTRRCRSRGACSVGSFPRAYRRALAAAQSSVRYRRPNEAHISIEPHVAKFYAALAVCASRISADGT